MTDQEESIDGIITQINPWKSGKGSFLKLDTIETDFFKFGHVASKVGDVVRIFYTKGTGNYADKFNINRTEKLVEGAQPTPPTEAQANFKPANELPKNTYHEDDTQARIKRSVTIKCASNLWASTLKDGDRTSIPDLIPEIIKTAKALEKYIEKGEVDEN